MNLEKIAINALGITVQLNEVVNSLKEEHREGSKKP